MAAVDKLLHTANGKDIMSALLGFGLATFFKTVCNGKNCIEFYAPSLEKIKEETFIHNSKCYNFNTMTTTCRSKKPYVTFE